MNPRFYAAFFGLTHEDRKHFEILVESDMEKIVQDCAEMWRSNLRRCYPDSILCRQMFLSRSVVIAAQHGVKTGYGGLVASAFALYVCDRVEQRVSEMDREEAQ